MDLVVGVVALASVDGDGDGDVLEWVATNVGAPALSVPLNKANRHAVRSGRSALGPRSCMVTDLSTKAKGRVNIGEAAGRASEADAARHFAIARVSAMECAAVLDVMQALGVVGEPHFREAIELIARVGLPC